MPQSLMRIDPGHIPGLLSAVGLINTVVSFAYTSALNRIAGIGYRRVVSFAMAGAWLAMLCLVASYVLSEILQGTWPVVSAVLVIAGLSAWLLSFPTVLVAVYLASRDAVGRGRSAVERGWLFKDMATDAAFGVAPIDEAIRHTVAAGRRVYYPLLLIHDIESPGLPMAQLFAAAGLGRGEAVVYLTFSRPHTTIRRQLEHVLHAAIPDGLLFIVDCYSKLYMPEAMAGVGPGTRFADPRNPRDVYQRYMQALDWLDRRYTNPELGVRVVYENLSDFIKIADTDLVMHYLRRVVVLEERRGVRALYLLWDGTVKGSVDQDYLLWFFSTTMDLRRIASVSPAAYALRTSRLYPEPISQELDSRLESRHGPLTISWPRLHGLARLVAGLHYQPLAHDFLPWLPRAGRVPDSVPDSVPGRVPELLAARPADPRADRVPAPQPDRARQVADFLLFMVAVDHDTRRAGVVYRAVLDDGIERHGSDLLYALAAEAKRHTPSLFRAETLATIDASAVAAMFRTPDGSLPADIEGRAQLFRDTARVLLRDYAGDTRRLLRDAGSLLGGPAGLFERLRGFAAYADPIAKKSNLLVKLLVREELFTPVDPQLLRVAIDHVVMTACLRAGIVRIPDPAQLKIVQAGQALDELAMAQLRETASAALDKLPALSGVSADRIDDLLWAYGRKALLFDTPLPDPTLVHCDLDDRLDASALLPFVQFTNGLDDDADPCWRHIPVVQGSYTPFF